MFCERQNRQKSVLFQSYGVRTKVLIIPIL